MDRSQCPNCGGRDIRTASAESHCADCGYIVDDSAELEHSEPGWTEYEKRRLAPAKRSRYLSKGTCIGTSAERARTRTVGFARLQTRLTSREQTLRAGLSELRSVVAALSLSDSVAEHGATMLRRAASEGLLSGRSVDAMGAACVYVAAKQREVPLTNQVVAQHAAESESRIRTHVRVLQRQLGVEIPPSTPFDYIPKITSAVGMDMGIECAARSLLESAQQCINLSGKNPAGLAAAAIYTVADDFGQPLTQPQLAKAAEVSVVTISRQHQTLSEFSYTYTDTLARRSKSGV